MSDSSRPQRERKRHSVLLVGSDPAVDAIARALGPMSEVERASADRAAEAAEMHAPDLIVLVGDAAEDRGVMALAMLRASPPAAIVPVVLIGDESAGPARGRFHYGPVATLARGSAPPELAEKLIEIAEALARRGPPGPRALDLDAREALELAADRSRAGILSIDVPGMGRQLVLPGEPLLRALEDARDTLDPLAPDDPVGVGWWETAPGAVRWLGDRSLGGGATGGIALSELRVVVLASGASGASEMAQWLTAAGAEPAVVHQGGAGVGKARMLGPDAIVMEASALQDLSDPAIMAIRGDVRLSWAALLVARRDASTEPADAPQLSRAVRSLLASADWLAEQAARNATFHTRLETMGPVRLLRMLLRLRRPLFVVVVHPSATVEIELADGQVFGARVSGRAGELGDGHVALRTLLELPSGRVRVARGESATLLNVMAKLDDAIAVALRERPLRLASMPPPPEPSPISTISRSALLPLLEARIDVLRAAKSQSEARATARPGGARNRRRAPEADRDTPREPTRSPRPPPPIEDSPLATPNLALAARADGGMRPRPASRHAGFLGLVFGAVTLALVAFWLMPRGAAVTEPPIERTSTPPPPAVASPIAEDLDEVESDAAADAELVRVSAPPLDTAELDETVIEGLIAEANAARHRADWDVARDRYLDVVHADPTNGRALAGLARMYQARGELWEAQHYAELLLAAHSDHPANYVLVADLLVARGNPEAARERLTEATRLFPHADVARARLEALER